FSLTLLSRRCLVHDLDHRVTPTILPSSVTATSAPPSGTYRYFIIAANIRAWRTRLWLSFGNMNSPTGPPFWKVSPIRAAMAEISVSVALLTRMLAAMSLRSSAHGSVLLQQRDQSSDLVRGMFRRQQQPDSVQPGADGWLSDRCRVDSVLQQPG